MRIINFVLLLLVCWCEEKVDVLFNTNFLTVFNPILNKPVEYRNLTITNIKVTRSGRIFVTFPRFCDSPITLGVLNLETKIIHAWPSWNRNTCNDVDCFFNVNAIEIDNQERLWIVDSGVRGDSNGTAKIMVYDMNGKNPDTTPEKISYFGEDVINFTHSFFSEIVVDPVNEIAFISDSGHLFPEEEKDVLYREYRRKLVGGSDDAKEYHPGLILFDFGTELTKRALFTSSSTEGDAKFFPRGHENCTLPMGIQSLALDCQFEKLFYSSFHSGEIHVVDTLTLLMYYNEKFINGSAKFAIKKPIGSAISAMVFTGSNRFLYSAIENQTIRDASLSSLSKSRVLVEKSKNNSFVWKFGFSREHAYFVSSALCDFFTDEVDPDNMFNFVISRVKTGSGSYIYGCDFSGYRVAAPEIILMVVTGGVVFVASIIVIIIENVLICVMKKKKSKK